MTNPTLQATHTQPSRSRDQRALSRSTVLALVGIALLVAGPWIFDSYVLNLLIKAFLFAIVVITVDVLWGYTGYLTFGQSAFFGIGAYAAGLVFTHFGLSPATIAIAIGLAIIVPMGVAALVGWLSFYRGGIPVLRHGDLTGASNRYDSTAAVRRRVDRLQLGADRL
ncbi:ABC transporter permease subunit [Pseudomonas capeferrum]